MSRESLLTNLIYRRPNLNDLQFAKGYTPSIRGLKSNEITQDLVDLYKEVSGKRAMQRVLQSREPNLVTKSMKHAGEKILFLQIIKKDRAS